MYLLEPKANQRGPYNRQPPHKKETDNSYIVPDAASPLCHSMPSYAPKGKYTFLRWQNFSSMIIHAVQLSTFAKSFLIVQLFWLKPVLVGQNLIFLIEVKSTIFWDLTSRIFLSWDTLDTLWKPSHALSSGLLKSDQILRYQDEHSFLNMFQPFSLFLQT